MTNSNKIFVNQAGYYPTDTKKAILNFPADSFSVVTPDGNAVFKGGCTRFGYDRASGDEVYIADFSSLTSEGEYRVLAGGEASPKFSVSENVNKKLFRDVMRAYYYLRCGMELKPEHAGKFTHAACHTAAAVDWLDHSIVKDVSGGWHDAGDYGRYVTPGAVACAQLLYAYILYPKAAGSLCMNIPISGGECSYSNTSGSHKMNVPESGGECPYSNTSGSHKMNIPESGGECSYPNTSGSHKMNIPEIGGKLPDWLAECKYELDWLLKMQKPDGSVYHKATTAQHARFVMPELDCEQMYLLPVSSMATADFAAVCALASRVYRPFDSEYSQKLLSAAEKTAAWLMDNPQFIGFMNPEGCGTGGYGEGGDKDNRFWAFAELYAATGRQEYHKAMQSYLVYDFSRTELGVGSVGGLGALAYILCDSPGKNKEFDGAFREMFQSHARRIKWMSSRSGYSCALTERDYNWGSNMGLMKNAMVCAIADTVCKTNEFRDVAKAQLDVLMGVNAIGVSYVTGNGEFAYNNPHLRPAFADGIEECIPGMVSGGPNSHPAEREARRFIPEGTPPMKCYVDRMEFYSINEITIYWNSPAAFTLAFLEDGRS